ncbi:MAG TPA: hypothetical protein VF691_05285, partial [Cytophagaceae bacterium]
MNKVFLFLALLYTSSSGSAFATTYYVTKTGSNGDGLTQAAAFRTIQQAVNSALTSGDVIKIGTGEYREQVALKASNVIIQPLGDGTVTLNGTEVLTGWSLEAGTTYKTSAMNWNLTDKWSQGVKDALGSNQLFQD